MERLSSYEADRLNDALYGMGKDGVEQTQVSARYVRTDSDGTAWVRFEGADKDTPLTSAMSVRAREGDIIDVSLGGYEAVGGGNRTDPSAGFQDVRAVTVEVEHVKGKQAEFEKVTAQELEADKARIGQLEADSAEIEELVAQKATIAELEAAEGRITSLESDHVSTTNLQAVNGEITNLKAKDATIEGNITAATGRISTLESDNVSVKSRITAAEGNITTLQSTKADISTLESDYITADEIDASYMHADMANADVAWIQNGVIKDGSISSAMINDVSANKLTAGTINGSVINVTNLNADNITTGTINGQRIGEGSLSLDKLSESVYTEAEVNNIADGLNDRIDGAIETFTGTAVPTLNNQPASSWNTTKLRDEHVGDVYYVVNSQSQQNGYCYRFTKSGSTYSWQLIKDSDVTAALSRLTTAEGKITMFDSDISTLKTTTGTLTTKTESLETRMSDAESDILDKVDTTTFNEVSDTVDQHSQTISQHTTAISNKADSSTVTTVTNRVSKNEQDISGINTTIGELQDTVEAKADGSTVSTISNKLNTVETTVNGHTETISSVQSTLATKADGSTVETLTTRVSDVEQDVSGFKTTVSETYATKGEAKQTDSDSGKREIVTENAAELPLLTLTAYGECSQDGTPTPDAPVAVKAVRGRNLLDPQAAGVTTDSYIGRNGNIYSAGKWCISDYIAVKPGESYKLSGIENHPNENTDNCRWYNASKEYINYSSISKGYAFVAPENAAYIQVCWKATENSTVQLENGTIATHYIPYGSIAAVAQGKNRNRAVNGSGTNTSTGLTTTVEDGVYKITGTAKNTGGRLDGVYKNSFFTIPAGTYTMSVDASGSGRLSELLHRYSDNAILARIDGVDNGAVTFTLSQTERVFIGINNIDNSTTYNKTVHIQLERGTEVTDYEPYQESVSHIDLKGEELCSLPDGTQDVLTVDASGHVEIEKRISTVTLDGTNESLLFVFGAVDGYYPYFYAIDAHWSAAGYPLPKHYGTQSANIFCNTLPVRALSDYRNSTNPGVQLWSDSSASFIFNAETGGTTQASVREWFAEHPTTLTYQLDEPYTIDLGYITPPTTFDGGTVHVDAEIQPVIDASWWTKAGYDAGKAYNDGNGSADLAALTERVTTAESSITQQAGQIALKANASDVYTKQAANALLEVKANKDTLTSEINASADTVKISADKVNIEGAAIFTSGRLSQSSLDGAYDASGAASAAQAAAISAAAADATSKANAAQAAAEATASADATSKANAAQAAAEATAAADATSKANAAQTAATDAANQATDQKLTSYSTTSQMNEAIGDAVDAIEVGGRNLLVDSSTGNGWGKSAFNATSCEYTRSTTATTESYVQAKTMTFEPGEIYTLSCWAKSNGYVKNLDLFKVHSSGGGSHQSKTNISLTTEYQKIVWTFTCNATTTETAYIRFDNNGSTTSGTEAILYIKEPKLEKGNKPTDWTPAPEDIEANAVKRTQRIYWRKSASGAPAAPGTASTNWVTNGNTESSWTKYNAWSTRIPPIAESKAEGATKYLYLYTCEQREMADGTLAYTTVLLDDTTTVIDGGNIITGSITANQIAVGAITVGTVSGLADELDAKADSETTGNRLESLEDNTAGYVDATFVPDNIPVANINGQLTVDKIDVDSLRAALLQVANLLIGEAASAHIQASGSRMSFMNGEQEVAYIDVDPNTNEAVFYMTRSIVVKDMQFGEGKWKWYKRDNNNMSLKWLGGM